MSYSIWCIHEDLFLSCFMCDISHCYRYLTVSSRIEVDENSVTAGKVNMKVKSKMWVSRMWSYLMFESKWQVPMRCPTSNGWLSHTAQWNKVEADMMKMRKRKRVENKMKVRQEWNLKGCWRYEKEEKNKEKWRKKRQRKLNKVQLPWSQWFFKYQ